MKSISVALAILLVLGLGGAVRAADAPEPSAKSVAFLKDKGALAMVERAQGFIYLAANLDMARIEKLYGMSDQMRAVLGAADVGEALKSVDGNLPMHMDLAAVDVLDAQTCSMLFILHGTEGPIGIKVYWQPSKNGPVHRVEVIWDWEEIEKMARHMDKVPPGYTVQVAKAPE